MLTYADTDFMQIKLDKRKSFDPADYAGFEHFKPEHHEWRGWAILRAAVALLAAAAIGAMMAGWGAA